jgi:hypothetical protein
MGAMPLNWAFGNIPLDTPFGKLFLLASLTIIIVLCVAALVSSRKREETRRSRMRRRDPVGLRARIEKRTPRSASRIAGLAPQRARDGDAPAREESREFPGIADFRESEPGSRPSRTPRRARSPWARAVLLVAAALVLLIGFAGTLLAVSPPLFFVIFFTGLFALEFLPAGKLKYAAIAAVPVGVALIIGSRVGPLVLWPIVVAATAGALLVAILLSRRRGAASESAGREGLQRKPLGEKTARLLGPPDPAFDHAREDRFLKPARESKAKGMYWRIP